VQGLIETSTGWGTPAVQTRIAGDWGRCLGCQHPLV